MGGRDCNARDGLSRREAGTIVQSQGWIEQKGSRDYYVQGQGWIEQKGSRDYSTRPGMD